MATTDLRRRDPASSGAGSAAGSGGLLLDCPVCLLAGGPVASPAEAVQLAGVHDDLRHRGAPTTTVRAAAGVR